MNANSCGSETLFKAPIIESNGGYGRVGWVGTSTAAGMGVRRPAASLAW